MAIFKETSIKSWVAGAALVGVSLCAGAALHAAAAGPTASVPISLTQQGRILDSAGVPVSSKVAIVFTVYDDPAASAAADTLWTETQNITLNDGYFSAQLGADAANPFPTGTFDGSVRYLGIKVGSDAEMAPRQAITSVPYALHAGFADTATNATNATNATSATNATNATNASEATGDLNARIATLEAAVAELGQVECNSITACAQIAGENTCGWCSASNHAFIGTASGPANPSSCPAASWRWAASSCP